MSQKRIQKLNKLLAPLIHEPHFRIDQAVDLCKEKKSGYLKKIIQQMTSDGLLTAETSHDGELKYCWATTEMQTVEKWIEGYVRKDQVTEIPLSERPRERLLLEGAERLSNADLLAVLIRVGIVGESAVVGGRKVANRFDNRLHDLRTTSQAEFRDISKTVTKASYASIMAGVELGRRIAKSELESRRRATSIQSTGMAVEYCKSEFEDLANDAVQEEFHIVCLDTKNKPIRTHRITVGTLDASLVHPREVFRPAIRDAAASVILVHNHPSGDPTPSREDIRVTDRLTEVGKLIGIEVLDHIVVGYQDAISIREHR